MKLRFLWRAGRSRFVDHATELNAISEAVKPGDTVCDVGANKGSYLLWLSRWVKEGRVVAFEPQEKLARYLVEIRDRMKLSNVTIEPVAVSSSSGSVDLFVPGKGDSPGASLSARINEQEHCRTTTVPTVKLDDYFPPETRISVLKVDVEGYELHVFKGAERILKSHSPLLVFECENRHLEEGSVEDVLAYLGRLGYSGSFVCQGKLRPAEEFRAEVHQRQEGERFWDAKDYCNNFIFRKGGG